MTPEQHAIFVADNFRREIERLEAERDQQAAEISRLREEQHICRGCGLRELHKMCPAWGTPAYMNDKHDAWGSVHGIIGLKNDYLRSTLTEALREIRYCQDCYEAIDEAGLYDALVQLAATIKAGLEPESPPTKRGTNEPPE